MILEVLDDRAGRGDRELLARDLEDECPEGVERRKFLQPGARTEVGPRVDDASENWVGFPQNLEPAVAIGGCCRRYSFSSRSVRTIWMTSATVSSRAQSRWSSTASATQLIGWPPACTTRSRPARCASSRGAADRVDDRIDVVALPERVERGERHADLRPQRAQDQLAPSRRPHGGEELGVFPGVRGRPVDRRVVGEHLRELRHGRSARVPVATLIVEWTIGMSNAFAVFTVETMFFEQQVADPSSWTAANCDGW